MAGPGSGKTLTIIRRVAALVLLFNIPPTDICISTFTRKSCAEIKHRLLAFDTLFPTPSHRNPSTSRSFSRVTVLTLHALAYRIVRNSYSLLGFPHRPRILPPQGILALRRMLDPGCDSGATDTGYSISPPSHVPDPHTARQILNTDPWLSILRTAGALDHDTALVFAVLALAISPPHTPHRHSPPLPSFSHFLLDEAQDLSEWQALLVTALRPTSITAVGDPRQGIYGFRGGTFSSLSLLHTHTERHTHIAAHVSPPSCLDVCAGRITLPSIPCPPPIARGARARRAHRGPLPSPSASHGTMPMTPSIPTPSPPPTHSSHGFRLCALTTNHRSHPAIQASSLALIAHGTCTEDTTSVHSYGAGHPPMAMEHCTSPVSPHLLIGLLRITPLRILDTPPSCTSDSTPMSMPTTSAPPPWTSRATSCTAHAFLTLSCSHDAETSQYRPSPAPWDQVNTPMGLNIPNHANPTHSTRPSPPAIASSYRLWTHRHSPPRPIPTANALPNPHRPTLTTSQVAHALVHAMPPTPTDTPPTQPPDCPTCAACAATGPCTKCPHPICPRRSTVALALFPNSAAEAVAVARHAAASAVAGLTVGIILRVGRDTETIVAALDALTTSPGGVSPFDAIAQIHTTGTLPSPHHSPHPPPISGPSTHTDHHTIRAPTGHHPCPSHTDTSHPYTWARAALASLSSPSLNLSVTHSTTPTRDPEMCSSSPDTPIPDTTMSGVRMATHALAHLLTTSSMTRYTPTCASATPTIHSGNNVPPTPPHPASIPIAPATLGLGLYLLLNEWGLTYTPNAHSANPSSSHDHPPPLSSTNLTVDNQGTKRPTPQWALQSPYPNHTTKRAKSHCSRNRQSTCRSRSILDLLHPKPRMPRQLSVPPTPSHTCGSMPSGHTLPRAHSDISPSPDPLPLSLSSSSSSVESPAPLHPHDPLPSPFPTSYSETRGPLLQDTTPPSPSHPSTVQPPSPRPRTSSTNTHTNIRKAPPPHCTRHVPATIAHILALILSTHTSLPCTTLAMTMGTAICALPDTALTQTPPPRHTQQQLKSHTATCTSDSLTFHSPASLSQSPSTSVFGPMFLPLLHECLLSMLGLGIGGITQPTHREARSPNTPTPDSSLILSVKHLTSAISEHLEHTLPPTLTHPCPVPDGHCASGGDSVQPMQSPSTTQLPPHSFLNKPSPQQAAACIAAVALPVSVSLTALALCGPHVPLTTTHSIMSHCSMHSLPNTDPVPPAEPARRPRRTSPPSLRQTTTIPAPTSSHSSQSSHPWVGVSSPAAILISATGAVLGALALVNIFFTTSRPSDTNTHGSALSSVDSLPNPHTAHTLPFAVGLALQLLPKSIRSSLDLPPSTHIPSDIKTQMPTHARSSTPHHPTSPPMQPSHVLPVQSPSSSSPPPLDSVPHAMRIFIASATYGAIPFLLLHPHALAACAGAMITTLDLALQSKPPRASLSIPLGLEPNRQPKAPHALPELPHTDTSNTKVYFQTHPTLSLSTVPSMNTESLLPSSSTPQPSHSHPHRTQVRSISVPPGPHPPPGTVGFMTASALFRNAATGDTQSSASPCPQQPQRTATIPPKQAQPPNLRTPPTSCTPDSNVLESTPTATAHTIPGTLLASLSLQFLITTSTVHVGAWLRPSPTRIPPTHPLLMSTTSRYPTCPARDSDPDPSSALPTPDPTAQESPHTSQDTTRTSLPYPPSGPQPRTLSQARGITMVPILPAWAFACTSRIAHPHIYSPTSSPSNSISNALSNALPDQPAPLPTVSFCPFEPITGSVYVGTVHSAKGLEFDAVFVPKLDRGTFPPQDHSEASLCPSSSQSDDSPSSSPSQLSIRTAHSSVRPHSPYCTVDPYTTQAIRPDCPALAEERRVLFVALSRARHVLVLSATGRAVSSPCYRPVCWRLVGHRDPADSNSHETSADSCVTCAPTVLDVTLIPESDSLPPHSTSPDATNTSSPRKCQSAQPSSNIHTGTTRTFAAYPLASTSSGRPSRFAFTVTVSRFLPDCVTWAVHGDTPGSIHPTATAPHQTSSPIPASHKSLPHVSPIPPGAIPVPPCILVSCLTPSHSLSISLRDPYGPGPLLPSLDGTHAPNLTSCLKDEPKRFGVSACPPTADIAPQFTSKPDHEPGAEPTTSVMALPMPRTPPAAVSGSLCPNPPHVRHLELRLLEPGPIVRKRRPRRSIPDDD